MQYQSIHIKTPPTNAVYYHSGHLGSTSYITDRQGNAEQFIVYMPYGEVLTEEHGSWESPYRFNGKEQDAETGLYYYGARYYEPQTAMWYGVDPMAEKYPNVGGYAYCANNPINFTDPTGMEVEEGSQQEWNKQKGYVTKERDKLQSKVDNLTAKAAAKGLNTEKLAGKIGNKQERINSLSGSLTNLGTLESSTQVYALSKTSGEMGGTTYDPSTGNVVFSFGSTANFVHETTHGGQFEAGEIAFSTAGQSFGNDVFDEVAAYKAQFAYSPSSISGLTSTSTATSFGTITPAWVQGITLNNGSTPYASGGKYNVGIAPVSINTNRDGLINAYPHLSGTLSSLPATFLLRNLPSIYYKR